MISKNEISISTLDGFLSFKNLKKAYEFIKATSCIKTEWFEAKIDFEISEERLIEFTEDFNKLNNGDINSVKVIWNIQRDPKSHSFCFDKQRLTVEISNMEKAIMALDSHIALEPKFVIFPE